MTLTATAYKGKIREIYTSRIGFCGQYNKEILSKMGSEFKRLYAYHHSCCIFLFTHGNIFYSNNTLMPHEEATSSSSLAPFE